MTKNCNDLDLIVNGVDSKFILFYQLWKELTDKRTLDSYQFRVMNTLSVLEELKKVIEQRLKRYHNSNHNIDECKKETQAIIKDDLVLCRLYRIRNEIAHSALKDGVSLIRYIEHLDDYLSSFVSEVVMCWEKSPESSIEHIFEIIKDNYQAYTDIRNARKAVQPLTLLSGLRDTGIIAMI